MQPSTAPVRQSGFSNGQAFGCIGAFTLFCIVLSVAGYRIPAAKPASEHSTPTPLSTLVSGNISDGQKIATRLITQYPKLQTTLNVLDVPVPKPGGIEIFGAGTASPSIAFILPLGEWNSLSATEKNDLQAYVANQVPWVAAHPDDYMIIPRTAPAYQNDITADFKMIEQVVS